MRSLFTPQVEPSDIPSIPGLSYRQEYVTTEEEARLVELIDGESWDKTWQRRRQPYGMGYGKAEHVPPIPDWGLSLARRMSAENISPRPFDQMLVNEYLPGQGIAMHRDYNPFDRIVVSLSLLSPCVMDFRHRKSGQRNSLLLMPRSLLILSDEARYDWEHGIAPRKTDRWHDLVIRRGRRISVTFRLVNAAA
jgi:alkylated DNA repair dioxygenase AlkB